MTKRDLTPPTSPRPIKRNTQAESDNSKQLPKTWAQVAQQKPDDQPQQIEWPKEVKPTECVRCHRTTAENNTKSQMRQIVINEHTLLCEKCTDDKENLEKHGSTKRIKTCDVCLVQTDMYDSRAGGSIVCSKICNDTLSVFAKVATDNSKKTRQQTIKEKVKVIARKTQE